MNSGDVFFECFRPQMQPLQKNQKIFLQKLPELLGIRCCEAHQLLITSSSLKSIMIIMIITIVAVLLVIVKLVVNIITQTILMIKIMPYISLSFVRQSVCNKPCGDSACDCCLSHWKRTIAMVCDPTRDFIGPSSWTDRRLSHKFKSGAESG